MQLTPREVSQLEQALDDGEVVTVGADDMTVADLAQRLHELRQLYDPGHDRCSCWCCCGDCDFEYLNEGGTMLSDADSAELETLS